MFEAAQPGAGRAPSHGPDPTAPPARPSGKRCPAHPDGRAHRRRAHGRQPGPGRLGHPPGAPARCLAGRAVRAEPQAGDLCPDLQRGPGPGRGAPDRRPDPQPWPRSVGRPAGVELGQADAGGRPRGRDPHPCRPLCAGDQPCLRVGDPRAGCLHGHAARPGQCRARPQSAARRGDRPGHDPRGRSRVRPARGAQGAEHRDRPVPGPCDAPDLHAGGG